MQIDSFLLIVNFLLPSNQLIWRNTKKNAAITFPTNTTLLFFDNPWIWVRTATISNLSYVKLWLFFRGAEFAAPEWDVLTDHLPFGEVDYQGGGCETMSSKSWHPEYRIEEKTNIAINHMLYYIYAHQ